VSVVGAVAGAVVGAVVGAPVAVVAVVAWWHRCSSSWGALRLRAARLAGPASNCLQLLSLRTVLQLYERTEDPACMLQHVLQYSRILQSYVHESADHQEAGWATTVVQIATYS
jgi:hypothetical protein